MAELLVVVAVLSILAALSVPVWRGWVKEMHYREAARNIALLLRDARNRAIVQNREHRVELDIGRARCRMTRGEKANGSGDFSHVVTDWVDLSSPSLVLKRTDNCDVDTNLNLHFNPNGTASSGYICVMSSDSPPVRKFKVGVNSSVTGRVVIER